MPEFHAKYGSLLKGQMAPLMRKRDKKKEKAKAEAAAKKKKELYTDVNIGEQGKRGAGRRQRVSVIEPRGSCALSESIVRRGAALLVSPGDACSMCLVTRGVSSFGRWFAKANRFLVD